VISPSVVAKMTSLMIDPLSIILAFILVSTTKNKALSIRVSIIVVVGIFWSMLSLWLAAKINGKEYVDYILNNLPLALTAFMLLCLIINGIRVLSNKIRKKG